MSGDIRMPPEPDRKEKMLVPILILAGIVMATAVIFIVYPSFVTFFGGAGGGQGTRQAVCETAPVPSPAKTTARTAAPAGPAGSQTTIPSPSQPVRQQTPFVQPTTAAAPKPFTLKVSPTSASAKPGETLTYTLAIEGGEGITVPVHLTLTAGALFFSQTYDLGQIEPPFPRSVTYDFTVPSNVPSGITINGILTGSGNGQTSEAQIALNVL
jgi:hypothetical protein